MGRGGRGGGRGTGASGKRWVILAAGQQQNKRHGQDSWFDSQSYYDNIDTYATERTILIIIVAILTALACLFISLRHRHRAFWYGGWLLIFLDVTAIILLMFLTDWTAFLVSLWFFGGIASLVVTIKLSVCLCSLCRRWSKGRRKTIIIIIDTDSESDQSSIIKSESLKSEDLESGAVADDEDGDCDGGDDRSCLSKLEYFPTPNWSRETLILPELPLNKDDNNRRTIQTQTN